jgi:hypothetical protein
LCEIILCRSLLISPLFTFSGNVDLTTPFGGAGINANVGLPAPGNNLLTTAVFGLGALSLLNTVATVVLPFLIKDEPTTPTTTAAPTTKKPDEADSDDSDDSDSDSDDKFRTMRNLFPQKTLDTLENAVVETLLKAKDKYL